MVVFGVLWKKLMKGVVYLFFNFNKVELIKELLVRGIEIVDIKKLEF